MQDIWEWSENESKEKNEEKNDQAKNLINEKLNENPNTIDTPINIKVVGIGGAGNNAINEMIKAKLTGAEFIAINTDRQVLKCSQAKKTLEIGKNSNGWGAGAKPERGRKAAEESLSEIEKIIDGAHLVIISSGMGGGTGTGAAPIVAKIAKEKGALTMAIVTTPFNFEGKKRKENAIQGIEELKKQVDAIIVISNDKVSKTAGNIPLQEAFSIADQVLKNAVRTITDLVIHPALINLDFEDLITTIKDKGNALIGIGKAEGENRAINAAREAVTSPILEKSIQGATHALVNICGGPDLPIFEAEKAINTIKELTNSNIEILFGFSNNDNLNGEIQVSVIATGIDDSNKQDDIISFSPKDEKIEEVNEEDAIKLPEKELDPEENLNIDNDFGEEMPIPSFVTFEDEEDE